MTNAEKALIDAVLAGVPTDDLVKAVMEERFSQPCFDFLLPYFENLQSARKNWANGIAVADQQWGGDVTSACIERVREKAGQ